MVKQKLTSLNDLPPEKLPEFWNDSARINALYAPFRDRAVNSRDWDAKTSFWKGIIGNWCRHNKICSFSESLLREHFVQNGRTPASLNIILNEMYRSGEIVTVDRYLTEPKKGWAGWAFDLTVRKPLSWTFNKVKSTFIPPVTTETCFIHVESVRNISGKLFKDLPDEYRNKVMTVDRLVDILDVKDMCNETVGLLLHTLKNEGKIDTADYRVEDKESVLMVKFACVNDKVEPIRTIDIGKYKLQENERILVERIEELEKEKMRAMEQTKSYLKKGMKQMVCFKRV